MRLVAITVVLAALLVCGGCQSVDSFKLGGPCAPEMVRLHTAF